MDGLESCKAEPGRMEILEGRDCIIINDAYNANPESMEKGISTFENIEFDGEKIAILGDMLELGESEIEKHRKIAPQLQSCPSINKFILVGNLAKHIADNFSSANLENTISCDDAALAKKELEQMKLEKCLLYFKASNSIGLNNIAAQIYREV